MSLSLTSSSSLAPLLLAAFEDKQTLPSQQQQQQLKQQLKQQQQQLKQQPSPQTNISVSPQMPPLGLSPKTTLENSTVLEKYKNQLNSFISGATQSW